MLGGLQALYFDTKSQVRANGELSAAFPVNSGVKQGCPASPLLFSMYFDRAHQYLLDHAPARLRARAPYLAMLATIILLYADDVALLASSPERLQELLSAFGDFCTTHGLRVGADKS